MPLEQQATFGYVLLIVFLCLPANAASATFLDMVTQAELIFVVPYPVLSHHGSATPYLIYVADKLKDVVHRRRVAIRPEILSPFRQLIACAEDTGVILLGEADIGIAFVILKQNVVMRLKSLDERILQQQRVLLGGNIDILYIPYLADKDSRLAILLLGEIAANAALKILGLTHIDYLPVLIIVLIAAGALRHIADDVLQLCRQDIFFFLGHSAIFGDAKHARCST